jgi:hypothetical protein
VADTAKTSPVMAAGLTNTTLADAARRAVARADQQADVTASHVTTDAMTPLREDGGD